MQHVQQLVPELGASQAVDEEVSGAVHNHKESGKEVKKISFLADMIVKVVFIAQFHCRQLGHLYQAKDQAGRVQDEEHQHQHHHCLGKLEFTRSSALGMEELSGLCHVGIYL